MQFHNWSSMIDEMCKINREARKWSLAQKFKEEMNNLVAYPFKNPNTRNKRMMRLCLEYDWIRSGRPYYNVHPQMCTKLARTNLDKIPARYIEIPENFPAILVRFTDAMPIRVVDGHQPHVVLNTLDFKLSPVGFRCALFGKYNFDQEPILKKLLPDQLAIDQYLLVVDEGARCMMDGQQRALLNSILLGVRPEQTIPEAFSHSIKEYGEKSMDGLLMTAMRERLENLFRVIVSIGFLADAPEGILVPDILNKDKRKWEDAKRTGNATAMTQIENRSKRRGKIGWNVGTSEMFVGEGRPMSPRGTAGTGQELQYSHIRGGHPHAVRYGKNKAKVKIKWFRPTRVREDLPFREE